MAGAPQTIGNYRLYEQIGSGGMGSVHIGQLFATGGFRRIVAIKRLHPHLAADVDFVSAFLDEARLASRIHHPNVVAPLDVVASNGEVFIVLEHVLGVSLASLIREAKHRQESVPPKIAAGVMIAVLHGLHAAHEATADDGEPLHLVHRDVSPQNILIGKDGVARLLDFGIAKAAGRAQSTGEGVVKGKQGYMAPEHLLGQAIPSSDIYSAAVVLWEMLAERRLFPDTSTVSQRIQGFGIDPLDNSPYASVAMRGLSHQPSARYATARDMAIALEEVGIATPREIGEWVGRVAHAHLSERMLLVSRAEKARLDSYEPIAAPDEGSQEVPVTALDASVETPAHTPTSKSSRSKRVIFAAGVLVLIAATALVLLLVRTRPRAEIGTGAAGTFGTESSASASASAAEEVATAPVVPVGPVGSSAAEPPKLRAPAARPAAHKSPPPVHGAASCKPYVIDKDGHKQFNEACLR
jgi:eukaryotic-like serine/threonine-protein kinase